jgi:hypothetical protein
MLGCLSTRHFSMVTVGEHRAPGASAFGQVRSFLRSICNGVPATAVDGLKRIPLQSVLAILGRVVMFVGFHKIKRRQVGCQNQTCFPRRSA